MERRLIILRGNSASGKTTVATALQRELGRGTMLLSQDVIRRQILRVSDKQKHPTMELISLMTSFGWNRNYHTVIIEGILSKSKNGQILEKLIEESTHAYIYYFDIPFSETLRRHLTKPNVNDYGEQEMREWWKEKDYLGIKNEIIIDEKPSQNEIITRIVGEVNQA